jgi:hypothetical protein
MALGLAACSDTLDVANTDNPDRSRALARPSDVEALIGSCYQGIHSSNLGGANDDIETQAITMGLESFSNLANFGMGPRALIPRSSIDNSRNNAANVGNYRDFLNLHRAARQAAVGLQAVSAPGFAFFTLAAPATNASAIARAKSMAYFCIGAALGDVAMIYDQGTAVSAANNGTLAPEPLIPFDSLMRYALANLDSAFVYTTPAANSFPLTSSQNWFGSPGLAMTQAQFRGLIQGYKARLFAGVARTPADRAAVNWDSVLNDASGMVANWTTDVNIPMSPSNGWDIVWISQMYASNQNAWHMMWQFVIGMADTSGAYATWLNTANTSKTSFLVQTPDRRFPAGATRAAQQAVGQGPPAVMPTVSGQLVYFRNRSAADWAGDPYANSMYDHERFAAYFNSSRIGPYPVMTLAEMRMLAAEADIRKGLFDAAAALINVSRTNAGLPVLPNGMTALTPVPGGSACVPRVPLLTAAATATTSCGTMLEAMKWEKRMETEFTGPYMWYTDGRGWGDLPINTGLQWPVPYQEIDTRQTSPNPPPYVLSYGGGGPNSAATNTYGLGLP